MTATTKKSSNLLVTIALLVFAGGIVASYFYKNYLVSSVTAKSSLQAPCNLRKAPCTHVFPNGGAVTFSITPKEIPLLKPLTLRVGTQGITASSVKVDFIGLNMDMGFNHSELKREAPDKYTGEFTIPICVNAKMEWEAQVTLETDQGVMMAPFHFYTIR